MQGPELSCNQSLFISSDPESSLNGRDIFYIIKYTHKFQRIDNKDNNDVGGYINDDDDDDDDDGLLDTAREKYELFWLRRRAPLPDLLVLPYDQLHAIII